jgi:hypothetical protein
MIGGCGDRIPEVAKPFALVQNPEEDVLRLDGAGAELADFGARVEDDLQRSRTEPVEHACQRQDTASRRSWVWRAAKAPNAW